jgi:dTDP-4-dehydrorhamnose reductase
MILRRSLAGEPLRVVNDQYMTPTYTFDLVGTVIALLACGATGTVHVTNGGLCTWYDFARATLQIAGIDHPIEAVSSTMFPSAARRPAYSALASERLASWKVPPQREWQAALRAYLIEKGVVAT